jgi:Ca2+-dependent lipid-binding protein
MLGTFEVTVLLATNLSSTDFLNSSDPYVTVFFNNVEWKTFIADLPRGSSRAIWNERLTFKIETEEQLISDITVKLFDKDLYKDDLLFSKILPISLQGEEEYMQIIELVSDEWQPRVHLVLHYNPLSTMQKIYENIDKYVEDAKNAFKEKLINQIMDLVQGSLFGKT